MSRRTLKSIRALADMVVVEQHGEQNSYGQSHKDPRDFEAPEVNQPTSACCGVESGSRRQEKEFCCTLERAVRDVHKAGPENCSNLISTSQLHHPT